MGGQDFQPVERHLYTVDEVARIFRVDRSTVFRWIASERLQVVKIGGTTRIAREEVQRLIRGS